MQKRYRLWYCIAIGVWLLIIGTINILNITMPLTFTFDVFERDAVILLVGVFSLYSINYYFDNL